MVSTERQLKEERKVDQLNDMSQASFSLTSLNQKGLLYLLLSGGGASVTIADEIYSNGYGKLLANYGEYSGNPNEEETAQYTQYIIDLIVRNNNYRKESNKPIILIIGGGTANFTDIYKTFKGVIKTLEKNKKMLQKAKVKIFVRRGGPNQKLGLQMMEKWLKENDLYGLVESPKLELDKIVTEAIQVLNSHDKD